MLSQRRQDDGDIVDDTEKDALGEVDDGGDGNEDSNLHNCDEGLGLAAPSPFLSQQQLNDESDGEDKSVLLLVHRETLRDRCRIETACKDPAD